MCEFLGNLSGVFISQIFICTHVRVINKLTNKKPLSK